MAFFLSDSVPCLHGIIGRLFCYLLNMFLFLQVTSENCSFRFSFRAHLSDYYPTQGMFHAKASGLAVLSKKPNQNVLWLVKHEEGYFFLPHLLL